MFARGLGQERVQAEGDQRDATARQSHLNQRLQELNEVVMCWMVFAR